MYTPDRTIVKRLKEYDPYLYVKWNNHKQFFEVWREMGHGHRLITPITRSIYLQSAPRSFVQLDERILWWLKEADAWSHKDGIKGHSMEGDRRWRQFIIDAHRASNRNYRDYAKDCYALTNNFYTKKHATRNAKHPQITSKGFVNKWVRPDITKLTSPRIMTRSAPNAKYYNYKKR